MLQILHLYYIENALTNYTYKSSLILDQNYYTNELNFYGLFNDRPVSSWKVFWASEPSQSGDITVSIKSLLLYL